ncbi:MAG: hypothetical protein ACI4EQ_10250 [Lachnospiraceae bacterium]
MKKKKIAILVTSVFTLLAVIVGAVAIYVKGVFGLRGVYFEPIETSKVSGVINPYYYYPESFLYYDEHIYTHQGTVSLDYFAEHIEDNLIGDVYSNYRYYWSTEKEILHNVTATGQLYSLDGYDDDFRVAVKFFTESMQVDAVWIFERVNDIWLKYGEDFYKDMLHIEDNTEIYVTSNSDRKETIQCDVDTADRFLKALYQGEFLEDNKSLREELHELYKEEYCIVKFVGEDGIEEYVILFPNGYVLHENQTTNLVVEVPDEVVDGIKNYLIRRNDK